MRKSSLYENRKIAGSEMYKAHKRMRKDGITSMSTQWMIILLVVWSLGNVNASSDFHVHAAQSQEWETTGTFSLSSSNKIYRQLEYSYRTGFKNSSFWAEVAVEANSSRGVFVSPGDPIFEPHEPLLINPNETWTQTYVQTTEIEGGDYESWPFEIALQLTNTSTTSSKAAGHYHLKLLDPGITFPPPGVLDRMRINSYESLGGLLILVSLGIWKRKKKQRKFA